MAWQIFGTEIVNAEYAKFISFFLQGYIPSELVGLLVGHDALVSVYFKFEAKIIVIGPPMNVS